MHYYNEVIEHPSRQIRLTFRFGNNSSCIFSIKMLELYGNQFLHTEIVTLNHNVTDRCELMKSNYDVVQSPRINSMTIALLTLLGTCVVRKQCVQYTLRVQRKVFDLSIEATINVHNASPCDWCAIFPSKNKQICFH